MLEWYAIRTAREYRGLVIVYENKKIMDIKSVLLCFFRRLFVKKNDVIPLLIIISLGMPLHIPLHICKITYFSLNKNPRLFFYGFGICKASSFSRYLPINRQCGPFWENWIFRKCAKNISHLLLIQIVIHNAK